MVALAGLRPKSRAPDRPRPPEPDAHQRGAGRCQHCRGAGRCRTLWDQGPRRERDPARSRHRRIGMASDRRLAASQEPHTRRLRQHLRARTDGRSPRPVGQLAAAGWPNFDPDFAEEPGPMYHVMSRGDHRIDGRKAVARGGGHLTDVLVSGSLPGRGFRAWPARRACPCPAKNLA